MAPTGSFAFIPSAIAATTTPIFRTCWAPRVKTARRVLIRQRTSSSIRPFWRQAAAASPEKPSTSSWSGNAGTTNGRRIFQCRCCTTRPRLCCPNIIVPSSIPSHRWVRRCNRPCQRRTLPQGWPICSKSRLQTNCLRSSSRRRPAEPCSTGWRKERHRARGWASTARKPAAGQLSMLPRQPGIPARSVSANSTGYCASSARRAMSTSSLRAPSLMFCCGSRNIC